MIGTTERLVVTECLQEIHKWRFDVAQILQYHPYVSLYTTCQYITSQHVTECIQRKCRCRDAHSHRRDNPSRALAVCSAVPLAPCPSCGRTTPSYPIHNYNQCTGRVRERGKCYIALCHFMMIQTLNSFIDDHCFLLIYRCLCACS